MTDSPALDPDLQSIARALASVADLVRRIDEEVGPGTLRGAGTVIERRRPEVYAAMEAVGLAVHGFLQSNPGPDHVAAAQDLVIGKLREISMTSPIALYGTQRKRAPLSYFEVVEHVRGGKQAGADVPARVLDDYYIHTRIGEAFLNRLTLLNQRFLDEVARCLTEGQNPLHVVSLQYVGGEPLLRLAQEPGKAADIQITCIDSSSAAVRHAEQTLRPIFNTRIQILMADPVTWVNEPACPSGSACVVYAVSLLEQLTPKRVVRLLKGIHRMLRPGGVVLAGSTAGKPPIAEQMIRDWLLGWEWKYRSEREWRELFAQTPFRVDNLEFEYESLGISALVRAAKTG